MGINDRALRGYLILLKIKENHSRQEYKYYCYPVLKFYWPSPDITSKITLWYFAIIEILGSVSSFSPSSTLKDFFFLLYITKDTVSLGHFVVVLLVEARASSFVTNFVRYNLFLNLVVRINLEYGWKYHILCSLFLSV